MFLGENCVPIACFKQEISLKECGASAGAISKMV